MRDQEKGGGAGNIDTRRLSEDRLRRLNLLMDSLLERAELGDKARRITEGLVDLLDADFARIWLTRPGDLCESGCRHAEVTEGPHVCRQRDRCLHLIASSGRYTHTDGEVHRRVPFGCYKIGRIAAAEEAGFLTNDVANDPRVHDHEWARRHGLVLLLLAIVIVMMVVGVVYWKWFIIELAGLFFAMGVVAGLISGMGVNDLAKTFVDGCKDISGAALIVGFAAGILHILESGNIMDTILYGMSSVTSNLPGVVSAHAMYVLQMLLNFFIPSGSTKAALTMPLMAPLADLSGITRQTAVLAYQFGDGFTNMIIPTSGVTVGTLALAKVPFEKWFRWNLPMQGLFFLMSLAFLVWPVLASWQ